MPAAMDPAVRDAYLGLIPEPQMTAMRRIYALAAASPHLTDKIACDDLFTFIAELRRQVADHETECPPREDELDDLDDGAA